MRRLQRPSSDGQVALKPACAVLDVQGEAYHHGRVLRRNCEPANQALEW